MTVQIPALPEAPASVFPGLAESTPELDVLWDLPEGLEGEIDAPWMQPAPEAS